MRCSTWPPPQGVPPYLHVCYLVLFPVEALHLVLLQLLSGLHVLVVVTLATHMQNTTFLWCCTEPQETPQKAMNVL